MANPGRDRRFYAFDPFNNDRLNRNPPLRPEPELAPNFGVNPFNPAIRANRPAGINPPFVFNPRPQRPRWNLRGDGQWGLNMNAQRRPVRAAAYDADEEYARFQARAFAPPQAPEQRPGAPPPPGNGEIPPAPPPPAPPAPPGPHAAAVAPPPVNGAAPPAPPPAQEGAARPDQNQAAGPPVIMLGRNGNAGTGRELDVAPAVVIYNLGRDLLGYLHAVLNAVQGFINAVLLAVSQVAGPLLQFATQWAVFLVCVAFALWASIPTVVRALVAAHRYVAVLLASLLEVLDWTFNLNIRWPRSSLVSYTLRPEYTSRAVTGMPYSLEPGVCPIGADIHGPPYGASALSSADMTMSTLPYPFSLPPISTVWTILWTLLIVPVSAALWALGAALAIDLKIWPDEDDDRDQ